MLIVKNRKALFNYEVIESFIAGIVLKGYEVKAIKEKNISFEGSFIKVRNYEVFVTGLHIGRYSKQSQNFDKLDPKRDRKLLLSKKEIINIVNELNQKGHTAVPLALVLKDNMVKLELAVVKGKKKHEKKVVAKEKQIKKDLEKFNKEHRSIL